MKKPSFGRRLLTRWLPAMLGAFLLIAVVTHFRSGDDLKPFASDGCSLFPDGTAEDKTLWRHCCVAHDYAYWQGGTHQQRALADEQLKVCVADTGKQGTGRLMLGGVRVGGLPWWPTPFRWGFGWPYPRGYGELTEEEMEMVEALSGDYKEE
jgi:hypothetical protein